jgi:hypothetical protein
MKKALVFLLLGGIGAAAFLLWRRSQIQSVADQDLWAPVETWPATGADRWPTTPSTVVEPVEPQVEANASDDQTSAPKRTPRKRAGS